MTKTAPAPVPTSSGGIPFGLKVIIGIVVVAVITIVGANEGWWGGEPDPTEEDTDQEREQVTWQVWWGQIVDTGEVYEDTGKPKGDFRCDERDLTITTYVDGEPAVHDQYDSDADREAEPCTWRWHQAVPRGSELRLLVEEGSPGGTPVNERWKMCQIDVNEYMVLPNGWATAPQGSDCEVWGVAL